MSLNFLRKKFNRINLQELIQRFVLRGRRKLIQCPPPIRSHQLFFIALSNENFDKMCNRGSYRKGITMVILFLYSALFTGKQSEPSYTIESSYFTPFLPHPRPFSPRLIPKRILFAARARNFLESLGLIFIIADKAQLRAFSFSLFPAARCEETRVCARVFILTKLGELLWDVLVIILCRLEFGVTKCLLHLRRAPLYACDVRTK